MIFINAFYSNVNNSGQCLKTGLTQRASSASISEILHVYFVDLVFVRFLKGFFETVFQSISSRLPERDMVGRRKIFKQS